MSTDPCDIQLISDTANKLFAHDYDLAFIRAYQEASDPDKQSLVALCQEMGWHGLIISEQAGGVGCGFDVLCALLEETGKAAFPTFYFSHYVAPALLVNELAAAEAARRLSSEIAAAQQIPAIVADSSTLESFCGGNAFSAKASSNEFSLTGEAQFVCDLDSATILLIPAKTTDGAIALFAVPPAQDGVKISEHFDESYGRTFSVTCNGALVAANGLISADVTRTLEHTFRLCAVAKSAEMIGSAERAMQFALEHIMIRKQFGKLLAEFQAVQHQAADMYKAVDVARLFLKEAIEHIEDGDELLEQAHYCKSWTNDASFQASATSHQLMGGTGYMQETDLQLLTSQIYRSQYEFGSSDYHREIIGKQLGL